MIGKFLQKVVNGEGDAVVIRIFGKAYVWKHGEYMGWHRR